MNKDLYRLYEVVPKGLAGIIFSGTENEVDRYVTKNTPSGNRLFMNGNFAVLQDGFTVDSDGWLTKTGA